MNKKIDNESLSLSGDYSNVALIILLYIMQGILIGVGYSLPIILHNKGNSFEDQAIFSLVFYPATVKVLWAPIVDSFSLKCCGRRKFWLVSTQLLIGCFFIFLSNHIEDWMNNEEKPKIQILTISFFILFMFGATQDCVIDGWSVNMLKHENRGYTGFCNQIGQVIGFSISYTALLILESKDFCNQFLFKDSTQTTGVVTFPLFFQYCGFGYIFTTLMIAFFKTEDDDKNKFQFEDQRQIGDSYKCLWQIAKLKNVLKLSAIMISMKFSVGACNGITDLKILQQGLSKEIFALLSYSKTLAKLIIPIIARNLTSGSRPLNVFMKVYPYRMISILAITIFIYFIPKMIQNGINDIFCLSLAIMLFLTEISPTIMMVAETSFYAKISDPMISATYMTFLATISNLGHSWIKTLYLYLMEPLTLTWKSCKISCVTLLLDGYYVEIIFGVIFSIFWYFIVKDTVEEIQNLPEKSWQVTSKVMMRRQEEDYNEEELKVLQNQV